MTEKLIIQDFVGIKSLEIELKKINVLIGPQASGKSICAKLLFYFKGFIWDLISSVQNEQTKRQMDAAYVRKFGEFFPSESWGKHKFFLRYEVDKNFIQITRSQSTSTGISLSYSDSYKKQLSFVRNQQRRLEKDRNDADGYLQPSSFDLMGRILENHEIFGEKPTFSQFFIPAGRSFFASLQNNVFSFLLNNNALDPFIKSFGSIYENMKGLHGYRNSFYKGRDVQGEIDKLIEQLLHGRYIRDKGKDFLDHMDGRRINVASSSSGQQETLPLAIMLSTFTSFSFLGSGRTIYIEEPEAHLFPSGQRNIVELIAAVFNVSRQESQFFITTHSPYVLTVFNNLLQAGTLYAAGLEEDKLYQLENLIPEWKTLLLKDMAAYSLSDQHCRNIVCQETGLIDTNIIDEVSNDLAIEFDRLLEIDVN